MKRSTLAKVKHVHDTAQDATQPAPIRELAQEQMAARGRCHKRNPVATLPQGLGVDGKTQFASAPPPRAGAGSPPTGKVVLLPCVPPRGSCAMLRGHERTHRTGAATMTVQQRTGADSETLVTADTAATMLAVSVRSVRRYAEEGRLAPVRIGRAVRYRLADVARLRAAAPDTSGQDTGQRTPDSGQERPAPDMSGVAAVSARAVDALREELAALRAENTILRQELTTRAEAAGMWQGRARTLEERLHQLAPPVAPQPPQDGPRSPEAPTVAQEDPPSVWDRLRRRWSREGG